MTTTVGLLRRYFIVHFLLAPPCVIFNVWFLKHIYQHVLINLNLKILLIFHSILACTISFHGFSTSMFYLSVDPCFSVMDEYQCKLISSPRSVSFMLISSTLVMISIERTYATYKYSTYGKRWKNTIIYCIMWTLILMYNLVSVGFFQILSLKSLTDSHKKIICMGSTFSSQTFSIIGGFLSMFVASLCVAIVSTNKIWNDQKLKNYQWFNRGQFDLRSRLQLSQNTDTNQSIFFMTLIFLVTFIAVTSSSLVPLIFPSINILASSYYSDDNNLKLYAVIFQQLYCLLYLFAYIFGSEQMRKQIFNRQRPIVKYLLRVRKKKIKPQGFELVQAKDKYFKDLENMWN